MAKCRSCQAEISWYKTPRGKNIPIDPEPHPDGNVQINEVDRVAIVVHPGTYVPLYRSHFSTCPTADQHRRSR